MASGRSSVCGELTLGVASLLHGRRRRLHRGARRVGHPLRVWRQRRLAAMWDWSKCGRRRDIVMEALGEAEQSVDAVQTFLVAIAQREGLIGQR